MQDDIHGRKRRHAGPTPGGATRSGAGATRYPRGAVRREVALGFALAACLCLGLVPLGAGAQSPADSASGSPSLQLPPVKGTVDTLHVRSRPVTLREIIRRAVEGERTKLGGHQDMTYTMVERTFVWWKKKREIHEAVYRGYDDASGRHVVVKIDRRAREEKLDDGRWVAKPKDDDGQPPVRVESGEMSAFRDLPFFLENQGEFTFTLLGRTIEVDHVIFEIGFRPKSTFKPLPSGTVFVDTDNYRIIHEVFTFEQNPFPLVLKDVTRVVRHWEELPGGEWVWTRILAEVELRDFWFGAPDRVDIAVERRDFVFDAGYDAHVFGTEP